MFLGHYALGLAAKRVTPGVLSPAAPPSVGALTGVAAIGGTLFTAWSWWADRHRAVRSTP